MDGQNYIAAIFILIAFFILVAILASQFLE